LIWRGRPNTYGTAAVIGVLQVSRPMDTTWRSTSGGRQLMFGWWKTS